MLNGLRSIKSNSGRMCLLVLVVLLGFGALVPATVAHALGATVVAASSSATDLRDIVGHVDEAHIRKLAAMGVVSGYGGDLFGPDDLVTREQFAKMLVLAAEVPVDSGGQTASLGFADSAQISDWARPYVAIAVQKGLLLGMGDGTFAPKSKVTRAQALTMIARALVGESALTAMVGASSATGFSDDASIQDWARPAVNYAVKQGIVSPGDHSDLKPDSYSTRALNCRYLSRYVGEILLSPATYRGATFSRSFEGPGYDGASSVQQTSDGGYVLVGRSWLMKLDPWGSKEWSRYLGNPSGYPISLSLLAARQTQDGGYVLAGIQWREDRQFASSDGLLIKTDARGNEEWSRTFGRWSELNDDDFYDVVQTRDGDYLVVGESCGEGWLVKVDARGNEEWSRVFPSGGLAGDYLYCIQPTQDGGYILAGTTMIKRFISESEFFPEDRVWPVGWLVKIDAMGNAEWMRTYEETWEFTSVQQTSEGGYILAGSNSDTEDFWMVATDASGQTVWSKRCGPGLLGPYRAVETEGGDYVLGGSWKYRSGGFLMKTDAQGKEKWFRSIARNPYERTQDPILTIPGSDTEESWVFEPWSLQPTEDGGYVVSGTSWYSKAEVSTRGAWVMKTDPRGNVESPHARLTPAPPSPSIDPADWGKDWSDWRETLAAGHKYRYTIKSYDLNGLKAGWFELSVADNGLTVAVSWSHSLDGEMSSNTFTGDPGNRTRWACDTECPNGVVADLFSLFRVVEECHLNSWQGGTWTEILKTSSMPSATVAYQLTLAIDGRGVYAGAIGAVGRWEQNWYDSGSLEASTSGEFCINPNVPLPLYLKIRDECFLHDNMIMEDGWREYILTEIGGS